MEENNFKTVKNPNTYKEYKKEKTSSSFGRNFLLPFFGGVLGCSLVLGTCFGVPTIDGRILFAAYTAVSE